MIRLTLSAHPPLTSSGPGRRSGHPSGQPPGTVRLIQFDHHHLAGWIVGMTAETPTLRRPGRRAGRPKRQPTGRCRVMARGWRADVQVKIPKPHAESVRPDSSSRDAGATRLAQRVTGRTHEREKGQAASWARLKLSEVMLNHPERLCLQTSSPPCPRLLPPWRCIPFQ
jgi:hypothetical protein